jgi:uncharacterized protein
VKFVLDNPAAVRIQGYDPGQIRLAIPPGVNSALRADPETGLTTVETSLLLTARHVDTGWQPQGYAELETSHLDVILQFDPELVLLGTGARLRFPPPEILQPLHRAGIGVEVMDTGAACRTFNILVAEGRQVVAGLLMIEPTG